MSKRNMKILVLGFAPCSSSSRCSTKVITNTISELASNFRDPIVPGAVIYTEIAKSKLNALSMICAKRQIDSIEPDAIMMLTDDGYEDDIATVTRSKKSRKKAEVEGDKIVYKRTLARHMQKTMKSAGIKVSKIDMLATDSYVLQRIGKRDFGWIRLPKELSTIDRRDETVKAVLAGICGMVSHAGGQKKPKDWNSYFGKIGIGSKNNSASDIIQLDVSIPRIKKETREVTNDTASESNSGVEVNVEMYNDYNITFDLSQGVDKCGMPLTGNTRSVPRRNSCTSILRKLDGSPTGCERRNSCTPMFNEASTKFERRVSWSSDCEFSVKSFTPHEDEWSHQSFESLEPETEEELDLIYS